MWSEPFQKVCCYIVYVNTFRVINGPLLPDTPLGPRFPLRHARNVLIAQASMGSS